MTSTIGIDPSVVAPAVATWPGCETWRIDIVGRGTDRLLAIYGAIHDLIALRAPDDLEAIFIERTFGRFDKRTLDQACGVIAVAAVHGLRERFPHPVSCFEVSTSEWRKTVFGRGNAKKQDAVEWAAEHGCRETVDECEALCMAYAGSLLLTRGDAA